MGIQVAVLGASGYAGGELLRLRARPPGPRGGALVAAGNAGRRLGELHPQLVTLADRPLVALEDPEAGAALGEVDLVFLALPHGTSAKVVAGLADDVAVVDLGADFRLADSRAWEGFYSGAHAGTWTYGLPELAGMREEIRRARRIANPGCYPTAVILALAPLLAAGVVEADDMVVVAASGTSGAGRSTTAHLLGSE